MGGREEGGQKERDGGRRGRRERVMNEETGRRKAVDYARREAKTENGIMDGKKTMPQGKGETEK